MGAPNLISDNMDCGLSYSVISYLKKLSQQVGLPFTWVASQMAPYFYVVHYFDQGT